MIKFEDVTITYSDASEPVLRNVDLHIPEGELCLVIGRTGSGKSTLLQAVNGLVPHFTGGTLRGRVSVAGRDPRIEGVKVTKMPQVAPAPNTFGLRGQPLIVE